jgi:hypothetical protein
MSNKRISDLLDENKDDGWFQENIVNNAPLIMAIFANLVVVAADVRAYDVIFRLTGSWWKALYASLACAIPFVLWEIAWQYNHTTESWRRTSLAMAGLAFFTSIFLGVADYLNFTGVWTNILLAGVVITTGIHTVVGLFYYYNDPDVARRRRRKQSLARMQDQQLNAQAAEELLASGASLLTLIEQLGKRFDPDDVERVLAHLQGRKSEDKPERGRSQQQRPAFAQDTQQVKSGDNGRVADPTQARLQQQDGR